MDRKDFLKKLALVPFVTFTVRPPEKNGIGVLACKTARDAEGPFYKANAPLRNIIKAEGTPLRIEGRIVKGDDCKTAVANAIVDIWHCNNNGDYDMTGYNCRAQAKTDANGNYHFTTIVPPSYGSRPRHIHFKIRAAGYRELTTQLYFEGDPNISNDFARNAEKDRVISLTTEGDGKKGVFNIYL